MVGELLAGVIDGVAAVAQLAADALGYAIGRLTGKLPAGESRFSARHVLLALTPLLLLVVTIVGILWYGDWRDRVRREQREQTREAVLQWSKQLSQRKDGGGRLKRHPRAELDVVDAWGEPLLVHYKRRPFGEAVTVTSKGRDKKAKTFDDISVTSEVVQPREVIRRLIDRT